MAEACEWAVPAFKVSGTDVIKDQATFEEVPFGESIFDAVLPLEEPVEGVIELGLFDRIVQTEHGSQRRDGGFQTESASGGQLGGGFENAGDDHGDNQISLGATGARKDRLQAEVTKSADRSGDVTVRSRALNLESVGGGDEGLAFEDTTESVDLDGRPSRKIGEGALDDSAIVAGALAKEDGRRGIAVRDGFHVHGYTLSQHNVHCN
jgi:hypothetical protein